MYDGDGHIQTRRRQLVATRSCSMRPTRSAWAKMQTTSCSGATTPRTWLSVARRFAWMVRSPSILVTRGHSSVVKSNCSRNCVVSCRRNAHCWRDLARRLERSRAWRQSHSQSHARQRRNEDDCSRRCRSGDWRSRRVDRYWRQEPSCVDRIDEQRDQLARYRRVGATTRHVRRRPHAFVCCLSMLLYGIGKVMLNGAALDSRHRVLRADASWFGYLSAAHVVVDVPPSSARSEFALPVTEHFVSSDAAAAVVKSETSATELHVAAGVESGHARVALTLDSVRFETRASQADTSRRSRLRYERHVSVQRLALRDDHLTVLSTAS